ncbi:hypothetical protein BATDEDRAFT_24326 [Batrachochytrium dendrobatidis JAM81]|uniref:Chromatin modification-related protein n=1 Tax=Batrachochytrium dendrobatidis (strain JAM81 / FGSC 10211) TaxID=684364 RepID=F4P2D8_BATDJ|nr:uncharacterized protein BATDEDRAFT_24326 [Batrachochytrium dendrobatidis JAM81]EGF80585.1 hypothetical protein BATDEDRAFT_24326 [Batrachochytrium dendrobatidis JAM81]|eukprot:XP_006678409.1 hypothetical protein BATDEDRAFT_24326 [Batrachochytrium dendrobatidis JAM81]
MGVLDCSQILEDYVPTIENVPSEIQFILSELSAKDAEFHALKDQIHHDESALRKLIKTGPLDSYGGSSKPIPTTESIPAVAGSIPSTLALLDSVAVSSSLQNVTATVCNPPTSSVTTTDTHVFAVPKTPMQLKQSKDQSPLSQPIVEETKLSEHTELDLLQKYQNDTRLQLVGIPDQLFLYENIQKSFAQAKLLADQKIEMAQQMREMLNRHERRLNMELEKLEESDAMALGVGNSMHTVSTPIASSVLMTASAAIASAASSYSNVLHATTPTPTLVPSLSSTSIRIPANFLSTPVTTNTLNGAVAANEQVQRIKRELSFGSDPFQHQLDRKIGTSSRPPLHKRTQKRKIEGPSLFSTDLARSETPEMDEQLYCFCQQVSYGEMIACDNEDCPHEWFHLECVGLSEPPNGVWFCKDCVQANKLRKVTR